MRLRLTLIGTALALSAFVLSPASILAQTAKAAKVDMKAAAPRIPNGKPDFSGSWEADKLVIDVVNMNGYAKLGTMGQPMSEQAHLIMEFTRPEMGHMTFNWTLDDPKTYTRPIKNERVFVLSPEVELMEYGCM